MYTSDKEAIILEHIYYNDSLKQRELADKAGISLGMTNAILKELVVKGYLEIKLTNSRNIKYVVTAYGRTILKMQKYAVFEEVIGIFSCYKAKIESIINDVIKKKYRTIVLVGDSNLDFLIEYFCKKKKILFVKKKSVEKKTEKLFIIFGETYSKECHESKEDGVYWLKELSWL